jgi:hypothetical protein
MTGPRTPETWYPLVIGVDVDGLLAELRDGAFLDEFYLARGTALALRLGHRRSVDLDFFTGKPFDQERLLARLVSAQEVSLLAKDVETLHLLVKGLRVSFIGYPYPLRFPPASFAGVPIADVRDIACMKISAIASRGARRDFIDLYAVARIHGLDFLIELFAKKYARANYSRVHILKSLTYFEDADREPMPWMLTNYSWREVKGYFQREAPGLL